MAVTIDTTSHGFKSGSSPLTISHTCNSGAALIVGIACNTAITITGVTYNGTAMTLVSTYTGNFRTVAFYKLLTPSTGTNDIVISYSGTSSVYGAGISLFGASDVDGINNNTGTTSPESVAVTTNRQNGIVIAGLSIDGSPPATISYTGSGTQWSNDGDSNGDSSFVYEIFSGGSDITHSWTTTASVLWSSLGIEVFSGNNYTKDLSETITLVDVISRQTGKNFVEVVALVDAVARTIGRRLIEVVTIVDLLRRVPQRRLIEAITIVDVITTARVRVANLSEIITIVDFCRRTLNRTLTEAITIVDTCARISGRSITFLETLLLSDILVKGLTRAIGLLETIAVLDIAVNFFKRTSGIMRGIAKKTGTILGTHKKE